MFRQRSALSSIRRRRRLNVVKDAAGARRHKEISPQKKAQSLGGKSVNRTQKLLQRRVPDRRDGLTTWSTPRHRHEQPLAIAPDQHEMLFIVQHQTSEQWMKLMLQL